MVNGLLTNQILPYQTECQKNKQMLTIIKNLEIIGLQEKNNFFLMKIFYLLLALLLLVTYGFYEKHRREQLYADFKANRKIICADVIVQKSRGWRIKGNRFFSNGKIMKTIIFCKSSD